MNISLENWTLSFCTSLRPQTIQSVGKNLSLGLAPTFEEWFCRSYSFSLLTAGLLKIIYLHRSDFFGGDLMLTLCSLQIYPSVLAETGSVPGKYPALTGHCFFSPHFQVVSANT